jgi:hypothetical protein
MYTANSSDTAWYRVFTLHADTFDDIGFEDADDRDHHSGLGRTTSSSSKPYTPAFILQRRPEHHLVHLVQQQQLGSQLELLVQYPRRRSELDRGTIRQRRQPSHPGRIGRDDSRRPAGGRRGRTRRTGECEATIVVERSVEWDHQWERDSRWFGKWRCHERLFGPQPGDWQ